MLSFEKALKRISKYKNKVHQIDYTTEYLAVLRRRFDFLYNIINNEYYEAYTEIEIENAKIEIQVVNSLVKFLEKEMYYKGDK